jgi:hypothetical protein
MSSEGTILDEEIGSWNGFPWALRKADREAWEAMVRDVREQFREAVEKSGKTFATDPFFMALLLAQQKIIRHLRAELEAQGVDFGGSPTSGSSLD